MTPRDRKILTSRYKYRDRWYRGLSPHVKLIYDYIFHAVDDAGIWRIDTEDAEDRIGFTRMEPRPTILWNEVFHELNLSPPDELSGKRELMSPPVVHKIDSGHWWLPRWIGFQFPIPLKLRADGCMVPRYVTVVRGLHRHGVLGLFEQYYPGSVPDCAKEGMPEYVNPTLPKLPKREAFRPPELRDVASWAEAQGLPDPEVTLFHAHYAASDWKVAGVRIDDIRHALATWRAKWECRKSNLPVLEARVQNLDEEILRCAKITELKPGTNFQVPTKEAQQQTNKAKEIKAAYAEEITRRRKGDHAG